MSIFSIDPPNKYQQADSHYDELETIIVDMGKQVITVDGIPVSITNGLYNFWAWVSPISPFTKSLLTENDVFTELENRVSRELFGDKCK